ncbi:hypothetical protein GCM10009830_00870 [Glycomyces endophyticus]|uniref:Uncharacterized protein n=1 Tax=Glycomyces endophyticus TaxID=480996 RepID=A0ABP4RU87_9ACTN
MTPHDDAPELLRRASAALEVDDPDLDLDAIMRRGYRERRRRSTVLGSAATAGVAAVAAVLALSLAGPPQTEQDPGPADDGDGDGAPVDAETSGYPYVLEGFGTDAERAQLNDAAVAAFGGLLEYAGVVAPDVEPDFDFQPVQEPGNYGQTWLRLYESQIWPEDGQTPDDAVLRVEAFLPGGWTAEPGPVTEQLFPRHLISASGWPWYTEADWTDELTTAELDDGRIVHSANHECAYESAVVFPNGAGLLVSWDMGCHEPSPQYQIPEEDFAAAVESMSAPDFDTTGLAPVGDLIEVPTGWLWDPGWPAGAADDASATMTAAHSALTELYLGATLDDGSALQLGGLEHNSVATRVYKGEGEYETPYADVSFELVYYLPGGWIPGIAGSGGEGPYPEACGEAFSCTQETNDDGTVWAVATGPETELPQQVRVVRFDPAGWAVAVRASSDEPIDAEALTEIAASMPAPVYDAAAVPQVPTD